MVQGIGGRATGQGGFTLVEGLVAISVMAIIVSVMASGITLALRAVYFQRTGATAVDEGRRLVPIITKDLQVATDASPMPVSLGAGTDLTLNGRDPEFDTPFTIVYSLDGSDLMRTLDTGGTVTARTVGRHVLAVDFSMSGSVYTVNLVTQSEGNTRSEATNTWEVYQRTVP